MRDLAGLRPPSWSRGAAQPTPSIRRVSSEQLASAAAVILLVATAMPGFDPGVGPQPIAEPLNMAGPVKGRAAASTEAVSRQGERGKQIAPQRETVIGAYGGSPYTYDSDVAMIKPGVHDFVAHDVAWRGMPFKSPIYYGVRVMRWFGVGSTGTMLDFTHSKAISSPDQKVKFTGTLDGKPAPAEAQIQDVFRRLEASHGHNMLTLNGLVRLPGPSAQISPYAGFGAGVSLPHSEVELKTDPARTYEYQMAGPVGQALFGFEFRLPQQSFFVEYKFSLAPYTMPLSQRDGTYLPVDLWRQFQQWWSRTPLPGGHLETQFTSHQVIGGIAVRIASP